MRLLIVGINFEPEQTGIAPYTTALAKHLAQHHDVTVLTGVPHYPDWTVPREFRRWRTEERDGRLTVVRLRHFVPRSPRVTGRIAYEVSFAIRALVAGLRMEADAMIAVVPALFGAQAARLLARRRGIPLGVVAQDIMGTAAAQSGVRGGQSISGLATSLERSVLRSADAVCTIHARLALELSRIANLRVEPTVIHNWTHVDAPTRSHADARAVLGWPDTKVVALHSGNMGNKQNLEVVVDAARLASRHAPHVEFVLAGGGNQRASLERYAAGCPNLRFLDGVADAEYTNLLVAADVLLVNERPGMREMSLPSKLTSYLCTGRPIVAATDTRSATGEFVTASGAGVVTPAGDPRALLDAVVRLTTDHAAADALAERGQRFAGEVLGQDNALQAYQKWVEELAENADA